MQNQLIHLLKKEFQIPPGAINFALAQRDKSSSHLHVILWQYEFLSNHQFRQVCQWIERQETVSINHLTPLKTRYLNNSFSSQYPDRIRMRLEKFKRSVVGDWQYKSKLFQAISR